MFLHFFFLFLLGVCGVVIGNACLAKLDPWLCFDRVGDRLIISTWIGILTLANYFLAISLFGALSPSVAISATLLLLGASVLSPQSRDFLRLLLHRSSPGTFFGITLLALSAAAYCSQVIVWYDSGLYHIQVVKWLSELGLVPGLALIHSRFGVVSSWFSLPAPFNHGMFSGRIMALPGALCLLLLLVQGVVACVRVSSQHSRRQDQFMAAAFLLLLPLILVWGMPNSPSPDFPVIVLVLVVSWAVFSIIDREEKYKDCKCATQVRLVPLVLAAGAVTIKLSALPLAAIAGCFYLVSGGLGKKKVLIAGSLFTLALLPVAVSGVVASGCAFYPVSSLCADMPWSLGSAAATAESTLIQEWARWGGRTTPAHATSWNWILPWFWAEKLCAVLIFLSFLAAISLVISRAGITRQNGYVMALALAGIAFMFYGAPTWRFGLGYLVILPALAAASHANAFPTILEMLNRVKLLKNIALSSVALAIFIALHVHVIQRPSYRLLDDALAKGLVTGNDRPHLNLLLPPLIWSLGYDVDKVTGKTLVFENLIIPDKVEDIQYYRTDPEKSDQCWDAPLPCAWDRLENIRLRQAQRGIAGGFEKIMR